MVRRPSCWLLVSMVGATLARAQGLGDHLNFETPLQDAVAVAKVNAVDYLLVCNAQDDSVEVYTATAAPVFLLRVPVAQEPVSVVVKPTPLADGSRVCYVACWLGDAIARFTLSPSGNPAAPLAFKVDRIMPAGDEPMRIAFLPQTGESWTQPGSPFFESLLVTNASRGQWGWFLADSVTRVVDPATQQPAGPFELMDPAGAKAVKEPRGIAFSPSTNHLFVLNFRGGNDGGPYDYDLWGTDNVISAAVQNRASSYGAIGGIGTSNFAMRFAANGDLYVVGQMARNTDPLLVPNRVTAVGGPIHLAMATGGTGFVESRLVRLRGLGSPSVVTEIRDLNHSGPNPQSPVQASIPVTQPTDVLVYGSGAQGQTRVFVTGFNSDTIGVVEPLDPPATPASKVNWTMHRIRLWPAGTGFSYQRLNDGMHGPRALALKASGLPNDPSDLLYVYNRVSHSITVLDPNFSASNPQSAVLGNFPLQRDPQLAHVRAGRKELYSSELSIAGNASCASCHVDGHTDFLPWNLADGTPVAPAGQGLAGALGPNASNKGPLVTQSLRGLVNFEVADDVAQDFMYSNRPYHWRGDRGFFEEFNEAFCNLMGLPNINPLATSPLQFKGITDAAMHAFREFTFSMHYPPNPEERWDRTYSGTLGAPNNIADGSGAQRGLELFVNQASTGAFACVNCHRFPAGSNLRFTEAFGFSGQPLPTNSIETAQLKALAAKETKLFRYSPYVGVLQLLPSAASPAITAEFGGVHTGEESILPISSRSIRDFIAGGFSLSQADTDDLTRFVREMDTGAAPLVGQTVTGFFGDYTGPGSGGDLYASSVEGEVKNANIGLAVHALINNQLHGYWFDARDGATPYHEIYAAGNPTGDLSRQMLLDRLNPGSSQGNPANLMVAHCTPLGSERRIAWLGAGAVPGGSTSAPANIQMQACRVDTANAMVPLLNLNWIPSLVDLLINPASFPGPTFDGDDNMSLGWFEVSLLVHGGPTAFGAQLRPDAPRRFRLSATGVAPGAILRVFAPLPGDVASGGQPTSIPTPADHPFAEFPIYPEAASGNVFWETAIETEPFILYGMLNGGPGNPAVIQSWVAPRTIVVDAVNNPMDPQRWNWWYIEVQNDPANPATKGVGGWQRLTVN